MEDVEEEDLEEVTEGEDKTKITTAILKARNSGIFLMFLILKVEK